MKNPHGFAWIPLLFVILAVSAVGGLYWYSQQQNVIDDNNPAVKNLQQEVQMQSNPINPKPAQSQIEPDTSITAALCNELYRKDATTLFFTKRDSNNQPVSEVTIDISKITSVDEHSATTNTSTKLSLSDWLAQPYLVPAVGTPDSEECAPGNFIIVGHYDSNNNFIATSISQTGQ